MRVIFVCTGNTCRSPLAESYAKTQFNTGDVVFESRGLMVQPGEVSSISQAIVARENLVMPSTPAPLTEEDAGGALLLVMTDAHRRAVMGEFPSADVRMISEFAEGYQEDVLDPYGGSMEDYERTFKQLKSFIDKFKF
ncbi:low molecular weight phosphatase family protein [Salinicoccus hispanicus]|uniref:Low molecular weight protein-tyrosine-phosphatase PtpB n=1 Tax=Salinicoccus hispanicus TaxID=157225 RepID=A0A6N8U698_9STAP|nr:low molecular weight phosphatase family protein [Salinicoccus hispanicus]MXQ51149.1 low molecular weight phosphatase family protein [Salinicoccus hispanicus]